MLQSAHSSTLPPSVAESRDTSPEQDTDTVVSIKSPLLGESSVECWWCESKSYESCLSHAPFGIALAVAIASEFRSVSDFLFH